MCVTDVKPRQIVLVLVGLLFILWLNIDSPISNEAIRIHVSQSPVADELQLLHQFQLGLQNGAIRSHYQAEIDFERPKWMGFEALSRWQDPLLGRIGPVVFIPLAEKHGLLAQLTCSQIKQLALDAPQLVANFGEVSLAFNMAPSLIGDPNVWQSLLQAIHRTQDIPLTWELEITETEPIDDFGRIKAALNELRQLGVKVVLDDFGTGWSSWSRAELIGADRIKIDSAFVRQHQTQASQRFLKLVAERAHDLNMAVTVEGVETPDEEAALRAFGFSRFQGWLYAKAMPLEEAKAFRFGG